MLLFIGRLFVLFSLFRSTVDTRLTRSRQLSKMGGDEEEEDKRRIAVGTGIQVDWPADGYRARGEHDSVPECRSRAGERCDAAGLITGHGTTDSVGGRRVGEPLSYFCRRHSAALSTPESPAAVDVDDAVVMKINGVGVEQSKRERMREREGTEGKEAVHTDTLAHTRYTLAAVASQLKSNDNNT